MKVMKIKQYEVLLNNRDFYQLSKYRWYVRILSGKPYAVRYDPTRKTKAGNQTWILMHREIMQFPKYVDHIDGDTLNNQRRNLRECTLSQNSINSKDYIKKSKLPRGVSELVVRRGNRLYIYFRPQICCKRKLYYLGSYKTVEAAKEAYDNAAKTLHGKFRHKS